MTINGFFPPFAGASGSPEPPPIIGPSFAYSTRKLLPLYPGPALRVVRISDSLQSDIGFDGSGNLDTAALLAFVGADPGVQGRLAKWYDQSGNGNDLASVAIGQGLQLVVDGALAATVGGQPALLSVPGDTVHPTINTCPMSPTAGTVTIVANAATGGSGNNPNFPDAGNPGVWDMNGGNPVDGWVLAFPQTVYPGAPAILYPRSYTIFPNQFQQPLTAPYTFGTSQIMMMRFDVGDTPPNKAYVGGGVPGTSNGAVPYNNAPPYTMGVGSTFSGTFDGKVSELIGYDTQLSVSDTNSLGLNQSLYWGLPWTPIT